MAVFNLFLSFFSPLFHPQMDFLFRYSTLMESHFLPQFPLKWFVELTKRNPFLKGKHLLPCESKIILKKKKKKAYKNTLFFVVRTSTTKN